MEMRALVAVIISLVILVGYSYFEIKYFRPTQVAKLQEAQKTENQKEEGQKPIVSKAQRDEIKLPSGASNVTGEKEVYYEEEIVVENNLYRAVLTNKGAEIKEFYVKKYLDTGKNPLNLVPKGENSPLPLTLTLGQEEYVKKINSAIYKISVGDRHIQLTPSTTQQTVEFVYNNESLLIRKALTFYDDKYAIDVNIDIENLESPGVAIPYQIFWGPGLFSDSSSNADSVQISTYLNGKKTDIKPDKLDKPQEYEGNIEWTAIHNKFFAAALIPGSPEAGVSAFKNTRGDLLVGLNFREKAGPGTDSFILYIGPKEIQRLKNYSPSLNKLIDYGFFAILVQPLQKLLHWFYNYTGNYGIAIILLTVLIKIIFFPLTHKSFKSMQGMQKMQPKIKTLQEKFKNDRARMNQEMMRIYRENKINPMGGCLPMVLQIPVFIALYQLLLNSIDLRMAPFFWWITDLSSKDPYYITPLIMGGSMFIQQKMTPTAGDPKMAKMMLFMPVIFTVMFLQFPVGLVIYWLVNNILTIGQQMIINRRGAVEVLKKKPEIVQESK